MFKKSYQVSLVTIVCIIVNYIGKNLALSLGLPIWLDSLGTAFAAYTLGPVCGAIVGATVNLIHGFLDGVSQWYILPNVLTGIIIGIGAKKGGLQDLFRVVNLCALVTVICTLVSAPINCVLYNGYPGNLWGDAVFEMLQEWRLGSILAAVVSEFYLDFLDKLVTLLPLYAVLRYLRSWRKKREEKQEATAEAGKKLVSLLAVAMIGSAVLVGGNRADAANQNDSARDYNSYIQTVYSNENGLLSGEANDLITTKDGIMWIGTYAGLYRYNGTEFTYMNQFDTVKNVNCLYVDEEGRMWIGTNDDGLSICIDEEIYNNLNEESGLASNSVRSVVQSADGPYYVGTSGALSVVSISGGIEIVDRIPEINYARSLTADEDGCVAAVTVSGELFLIRKGKVVQMMEDSTVNESFTCCCYGKDGLLYVGTSRNVVEVYAYASGSFRLNRSIECGDLMYINSLEVDEEGHIFICADNGIGYLGEDKNYHPLNTGNFRSSIDHMTVDYQGNLWFSSSRLGILKLSSSAFSEVYSELNLVPTVVNAVVNWQGDYYFGTDNGLDAADSTMRQVVKNKLTTLLKGRRVRNLMVDSNGDLWIGAYGVGLLNVKADGTMKVFSEENGTLGSKFRCSIERKDGTIVSSTDLGVNFIRDGAVTETIGQKNGLTNPLVLCLLETENGRLLAGTDGGGIALIENGVITHTYTRQHGLSSGVILRMVQDPETKGIFIVTSNGLCYMDGRGSIRSLSNFPYSNNYDLYDSGDGNLFVIGSAGIYVVKKSELLGGGTVNYELLNYLSGLRGSFTANAWNMADGEDSLLICNNQGVTRLDLKRYHQKPRSYRMLMRRVLVDDMPQDVELGEAIRVSRDSYKLEIHPEIINYSTSDPYISYYMEGVDADPIVVRQSSLGSIHYSNLASGTYRFELAILDGNPGNVMEQRTYTIIKEAELYDHPWFKAYFFIELIFIVAWLTWLFTRKKAQRRLDLHQRELELARRQVQMGNETIMAIARTVDAKDSNTSHHSTRVSEYAAMIADKLGYSYEDRENLRKAALLHDIGKIAIPDSVLNKPGRLTDEEFAIMKSHVQAGGEILKDFSLIPNVQDGAMYHHERYDGRGYGLGLKGEQIPEWARIIGIADAFDAMTANRVYRKRLPPDVVLGEIKKGRGTQFDPKMVDIFLELVEEGKIDMNSLYDEGSEGA